MRRHEKFLSAELDDRLTLTREFKTRHSLAVGRSRLAVLVRGSSINLLLMLMLMLGRKGPKSPIGLETQE
jgi:hypothetical protein